jgi:predicted DsbA family dithiol-disulfide isomerase
MIRKFGSQEAFDRVKKSHGLIPRGAEVGLDASVGYTQAQLDLRIQSSTLNSHRLILYVAQRFGLGKSEQLYDIFNRRHFLEAGILNDRKLLVDSLEELELKSVDLEETIAFLDDESRGTAQVLELYNRVTGMGIYSIPTLLVDGRFSISGAQRASGVLDVLERASDNPIGQGVFTDVVVQ